MPILQMNGVKKIYRRGVTEVQALRGIDMDIEEGDFLAIVGPSGSGKSTLLNIIGCLDSASTGSVLYNGTQLSNRSEKELSEYRKKNIGFIFQSYNLIPVLNVRENVELPLVIDKKLSKQEMALKSLKVIESVGLKDMVDRYPRELSGGQEQRVAIARALVKDPLVVLADEPTANLDSATAEEIISVMKEMNKNLKTTFIFSTHDKLVETHAQRVVVLHDGLISHDERKYL
ncbi:MAG: ABC transporter ATP-binding protein [Clostridiaceae bacterium]|nr:ABC transporter ATP-binding protein [Clostridiaceae bacterium]